MSTLSVNNITTQSGSTITIPSGKTLISPNTTLQSVTTTDGDGLILSNSAITKFMDVAFTTKAANSVITVRFHTQVYRTATSTGNRDTDVAMGLGFKTGSATASSSDYTAITTKNYSRENITFSGSVNRAFYSSDAFYAGGTYAGRYHPLTTIFNEESFSPSLAAGTTIRIAVFAKQDYGLSQQMKLGASASGGGDSGCQSSLNITEVAAS